MAFSGHSARIAAFLAFLAHRFTALCPDYLSKGVVFSSTNICARFLMMSLRASTLSQGTPTNWVKPLNYANDTWHFGPHSFDVRRCPATRDPTKAGEGKSHIW